MTTRSGSCLCGAVRYQAAGEPLAARICWCRDCQRLAANGTVNALFPTGALEVVGTPAEFVRTAASGHSVLRRFCAQCGTQLFADSSGRPGMTVIRVGTLDDPSSIAPASNIWADSAPGWACLSATLERVPKQPMPPPAAGKAP